MRFLFRLYYLTILLISWNLLKFRSVLIRNFTRFDFIYIVENVICYLSFFPPYSVCLVFMVCLIRCLRFNSSVQNGRNFSTGRLNLYIFSSITILFFFAVS